MKTVIIFTLSMLLLLSLSCICNAQHPERYKDRYFGAIFYGQDSVGGIKFGTYYFTTKKNYFPTLEDCMRIVIDGYKLKFTYNSTSLALMINEFKNKEEFDKFNHIIK